MGDRKRFVQAFAETLAKRSLQIRIRCFVELSPGRKPSDRWTWSYLSSKMVSMKSATRITSKGQVVIPKPVREQLHWPAGTRLAIEIIDEGTVRLGLLDFADPIENLYGCLKLAPRDPLADLEAEHRAEIEADEPWQDRGR